MTTHHIDLTKVPWFCALVKIRPGVRVDLHCELRRMSHSTLGEGFVIRTKEDVEAFTGEAWDSGPDVMFLPNELNREAVYHYRAPPIQSLGRIHLRIGNELTDPDTARSKASRDPTIIRKAFFAVTPDPMRSVYAVVFQMSKTKTYVRDTKESMVPDVFDIHTPSEVLKVSGAPDAMKLVTEPRTGDLQMYCSPIKFSRYVDVATNFERISAAQGKIAFVPEIVTRTTKRPRDESESDTDVPMAIRALQKAIDVEKDTFVDALKAETAAKIRYAAEVDMLRSKLKRAEDQIETLAEHLKRARAMIATRDRRITELEVTQSS